MKRSGSVMRAFGLALLGALALLSMAGCGGGGGTPPPPDVEVQEPVEDPSQPTAIGGTVFTLANSIIDQAYSAEITLTGTPDNPAHGASITRTTRSTIRGGYQFTDLPAGTYALQATVELQRIPNTIVTGSITGVVAKGNIPKLMVNLLLGEESSMGTFTGVITQNDQPAAGAVVSVEVDAYTTDHLNGSNQTSAVILSTNTNAEGRYTIHVPAGGINPNPGDPASGAYYIAAHSDTSMVSQMNFASLAPGETKTVNLSLTAAEPPQFSDLLPDIVSTTLPAPTALASEQAMIARLAVARSLDSSPEKISRLEKLAQARRGSRAEGGFIENDVYWTLLSGDVGVRGFHIYRSTILEGPYTRVGSTFDPYQVSFFDNSPTLSVGESVYYRISSYAANNQVSKPSSAVTASPLAQIAVNWSQEEERISWQPVMGAQAYMVLIYNAVPTFNTMPRTDGVHLLLGTETSLPLSYLAAGEYWWSVSAYNSSDPASATAVSYTDFRKVTLE